MLEAEPEPEVARTSKESRGKRGRKRKSAAVEAANEPEPEPELAQMIAAPEPWSALGTGCGAVELVENRLLRKSLPYVMGPQ